MGKKGSWFVAVKNALTPSSKRGKKAKKNALNKPNNLEPVGSSKGVAPVVRVPTPHSRPPLSPPHPLPPTPTLSHPEMDEKVIEDKNETRKHPHPIELATDEATETTDAATHVPVEPSRLSSIARFMGKSKEEVASIRIQTAFREYLSKKAVRALRGQMRLKTLIQGQSVKRQATTTLRCMQTLARVQSQIRARRIRLSKENQTRHQQILQKHEKEKTRGCIGGDFDLSVKSKEKVDAEQQHKQKVAMRREKALAYAFSHQQVWKNSSKSPNPTLVDPKNPHWGWSWLERWMAERPWECRGTIDLNEQTSVKNRKTTHSRIKPSKPNQPPASTATSTSSRKTRTKQTRDDKCNILHSEQHCVQHSDSESSSRNNESFTSTPQTLPSYMTPTEATMAKSRSGDNYNGIISVSSQRRHSGPPKVDLTTIKGNEMCKEEKPASRSRRVSHEI